MSDVPQNLQPIGNLVPEVGGHGLPPSLQILLNEGLYTRIKQLSAVMANARGVTPAHLVDKPEACFSIINMSLDWKLSPHFVARHTYQTPGGQIGFDGALVQAVLEQSGRFIGGPQMEYRGDWQSLVGKFELKTGQRGGTFAVPTWTAKDAIGLGVIVRWRVKGEEVARVWPGENDPFQLTQCFPLNSPLWATDPKTQIAYLAIRRFANLTSPGILGAAAFDQNELLDASERAIDVTEPRPRREDYSIPPEPAVPTAEFAVVDLDGVEHTYASGGAATQAFHVCLVEAARLGADRLLGWWEDNRNAIDLLAAAGFVHEATELVRAYDEARLPKPPAAPAAAEGQPWPLDAGGEAVFADEIAMPLKNNKPDPRTWALALLIPKMRRCSSSNELAGLLGANEHNLELARAPGSMTAIDLAEMERVIAEEWQRLPAD